MVSTRAQKAKNGNAQPQQPPLPQQHPAPQPAPQQAGGRRKPRKPAKPTKKPAKATKAANDEHNDVVDEVEDVEDELKNVEDRVEDIEDDAPVKFNLGRKRPRSATSEGPSQKARKTGAAGPSNHDATRSGPPTGDAVSSKQAQSRGKGKGKQKEEPAAPNVSAVFSCTMSPTGLMKSYVLMDIRTDSNWRTAPRIISKVQNLNKSFKTLGRPL
jgi:hypothetical protein